MLMDNVHDTIRQSFRKNVSNVCTGGRTNGSMRVSFIRIIVKKKKRKATEETFLDYIYLVF